ncbi:hypothetical protein GLOIN_2v1781004 [Rhizophagus irregularis DAOM 181602=DAOM 197198]|uniref:Protein kinase domain-containing protein n=1 Tax=Rhizophagus irregularis (strain DAOM 181602 / DAOM 197198 / MUCL 43194) TaxID=747089 RepID=A0A2P4PKU8_RHIID|nr:hypothetical protein GLOIN_2v1781004 [Rhizophagus irregularis DAOM 181602=DAOM 197198]POG66023.1 hypothetical protein GLOIN_2v1781004 [Rhizophagus irregularis DAOM 181602=DAOM 197198]|eukprot:XP_025172889.1 hypothetical protein GLOIN_2v1781004 [Rhizophagus irregularis DAOM 181602=DAOM 197198]
MADFQIKDFSRYHLTKEQKSLVDKDKLSDDVFDQIKEFDHHFLTKEQESLIDNLITDKELKERYKENDVEYLAKRIFEAVWRDDPWVLIDYKIIRLKRKINSSRFSLWEYTVLSNNIHQAYITDLGLCQPANDKSSQNNNKKLYGVLPYVAPEVLRGKEYTQARLRSKSNYKIPQLIFDIINKCWDADPLKRPNASNKLCELINYFYFNI